MALQLEAEACLTPGLSFLTTIKYYPERMVIVSGLRRSTWSGGTGREEEILTKGTEEKEDTPGGLEKGM